MKRLAVLFVLAVAGVMCSSESAQAQRAAGGFGYPFFPWGFYQPYGARYANAIPNPPYFSLNPPVYYGARYARPYGMSPFASPPVVSAPKGFQGRLRTEFEEPVRDTPPPRCNPYLCKSSVVPQPDAKPFVAKTVKQVGPVRENPFFSAEADPDKLATK